MMNLHYEIEVDQPKTFEEVETEWLHALGITNVDETDFEYDSLSESSYNNDDDSATYGDEETINDRIINDWVAYLEGIIDNDDVNKNWKLVINYFIYLT